MARHRGWRCAALCSIDPRSYSLTLRTLWTRYEHYLARRFPGADTLLTTWEDAFEREQWEGFLVGIGYHKSEPAVFRKGLPNLNAGV